MNGFVTESMRRIVTAHGIINKSGVNEVADKKEMVTSTIKKSKPVSEGRKKKIDTVKKESNVLSKEEEKLLKKRENTRQYLKKNDMIYLRLPVENKELGIPNYKQIVTEYVKKNGVSVNGLLTALVERELGIEIIGLAQIRENARARIREQ